MVLGPNIKNGFDILMLNMGFISLYQVWFLYIDNNYGLCLNIKNGFYILILSMVFIF